MFRYRMSGLEISTDIELPGLFSGDGGALPDVRVRQGAVPDMLPGAQETGPNWAATPQELLLRVPGVARFRLSRGRAVVYQPEARAAASDLTAFIVGAAFGPLLHQRGLIVLQASAVEVDERAVVFAGRSGSGKSTLAAVLAARGLTVVADDLCVVFAGADGRSMAQPQAADLQLWAQAVAQLGLAARRGAAVRPAISKFHVRVSDPPATTAPLPLGPIYFLREARGPFAPGIERPNIVDTALLVQAHACRPRLVRLLGQAGVYFRMSATIGNAAGAFILTREMRFAALEGHAAELERHWAQPQVLAGAA